MYREASGEDAKKKKPVDSEKDALKSRKQMEDSRQVRSDTIGRGLLMLLNWKHLYQLRDERILQKRKWK